MFGIYHYTTKPEVGGDHFRLGARTHARTDGQLENPALRAVLLRCHSINLVQGRRRGYGHDGRNHSNFCIRMLAIYWR